jgi:hypothetical protein
MMQFIWSSLIFIYSDGEKRAKGEPTYRTDKLLNISALTNNTNFTEVREYVGYSPLTSEEKVRSQ